MKNTDYNILAESIRRTLETSKEQLDAEYYGVVEGALAQLTKELMSHFFETDIKFRPYVFLADTALPPHLFAI